MASGALHAELWGCRVHFAFRWRKLLEFSDEFLEGSENSVATVIAAQRAAQRTVGDPAQRQRRKMQLVRQLYTRGYDRQQVLDLFRLIDWQMALPGPLEIAFQREVVELEKEQVMPYVTSIERLGREEGIKLGRQDGRVEAAREAVQEALRIRFGEAPNPIAEAIAETSDLDVLREWHRQAITAPSLEVFSEWIHLPLRNGLGS